MMILRKIILMCTMFIFVCGSENETLEMMNFLNIEQLVFKIGNFLNNKAIYTSLLTSECFHDLHLYLNGIKDGKGWALAMFDSIEKFPTALIFGKRVIPGQFYQCIDVVHENITGQHCMIELASKKNSTDRILHWVYNGAERVISGQFSYGVCIPASCSANDLKNILKSLEVDKYLNFNVDDSSCTTSDFQKMRVEDWVTTGVIVFVILLAIASTSYDLYQIRYKKNDSRNQILVSFSFYTNWKLLFQIRPDSMKLNALHGIRFFSISWVVLGHFFSYLYHEPIANFMDGLMLTNDKLAIPGTNGYLSVDSFFFLSGLLVCFVFFRDYSKKGSFDVPVALIHRYLRLTPPFAIVVLFHATLFSRMGNGPFWKPEVEEIEISCRESWWSDLLYIDNYISPLKKCLGQTWYLCADMQMFWLSPFILYFILLVPKLAPAYLFLLIAMSSLTSFITSYYYNLPPSISTRINPIKLSEEANEYRHFHTRMTPWIIGVATGYIICGIHAKKINMNLSKVWIIVGWVVSAVLCLGSLYGIAAFMPIGTPRSNLKNSSYRAFHRAGWALGLSWIVIACVSGYGGPVNTLLSLDIFQPLAKLSYSIFLIHKTVQQYRCSNAKSLEYLTFSDGVYVYLGDMMISVILSIPFTLLFEMPFAHIDKYLLKDLEIFPFPKSAKIRNKEDKIQNIKDKSIMSNKSDEKQKFSY